MAPPVFMTLAQPWSNNHYANLIFCLSASIYVVGAAPYFIIVFGATMASPLFETQPPAPIVFLPVALNLFLTLAQGAPIFIKNIGAAGN